MFQLRSHAAWSAAAAHVIAARACARPAYPHTPSLRLWRPAPGSECAGHSRPPSLATRLARQAALALEGCFRRGSSASEQALLLGNLELLLARTRQVARGVLAGLRGGKGLRVAGCNAAWFVETPDGVSARRRVAGRVLAGLSTRTSCTLLHAACVQTVPPATTSVSPRPTGRGTSP